MRKKNMAIAVPGTTSLRLWGVLVLCLCASLLSACKTELFAHLEEADANAVMTALYADGISAVKTPVDEKYWRIEVDESDQQRALLVARNQGVPRERFANMGDLFKKEGLVSTPSEVRMRYVFALSQELSNTLSHIDGVISARVHPVIPVNDPLSDKTQPASAAVFIKHLPDADLQQMAPAIKTLIARSIDGLKVENVSLTFFSTRAPLQGLAQPSGGLPIGSVGSVGSSLTILLAALLAMTWGALGWVMLRNQHKRPSKTGTVVESTPRGSPPGSEGEAQAVGGNAALWRNRRATDLLVVPSATAGAVTQSAALSPEASTEFAIDSVDRD